MSSDRHWHREPHESTKRFADEAVFVPTAKGLKAVIEVIAYPAGHVGIASSSVSGPPRNRTIVQTGEPLMFNDMAEAKDAVDLILDRLATESQSA